MLASIEAWLVTVLRRIAENEALNDPSYDGEPEVGTIKDVDQQVMQGSGAQSSASQEGGPENMGNLERPWSSSD